MNEREVINQPAVCEAQEPEAAGACDKEMDRYMFFLKAVATEIAPHE